MRVDREGEALAAFQFDLRERMTQNLVRRLPKYAGPAQAVAATAPLPRGNYWLVTGNFDRVNQGSRFLRSVVGLGAGGTKMDTTVVISDLSTGRKAPFLRIKTTGGSNISQGIGGAASFFLTGPTALTSLFNAADGLRSGVTFDAVRTSRELNASLSEYLYQEGAIPYEQSVSPKKSGQLPSLLVTPDRAKMRKAPKVVPDGSK